MPEQTPQTAKILIVDDEVVNVQLLERLLRQAGYTNHRSTTDPRNVAAIYAEYQPDLILLDLRMPHRDGFAVLEDLQLLIPRGSYVPVLVLTADVTSEALRRALLSGARDFLTKPFDAQEVLLRIRNLLETRFLHLALQYQNQVLEERVEERTRQLLQMEKLSAMGQLLAGVAHELNNPLAVVTGQAHLMKLETEGSPLARRAEKLAKAAERCVRIVRNFLALARDRAPERTAVDLNGVVREAIELLAYELRTDNVEVRLELADDLPRLWADPHQLVQVLVNLIANAHQAMRHTAGPRAISVTSGVEPPSGWIRLILTDTGPGIRPEIQPRIFEPFFTTKPPGQGTGLGLSLSAGIIEDHGGRIRVQGEVGEGATFVIELPVGAPPAIPAPSAGDRVPMSREARRILVVDDELGVAEILMEFLQREGHQVDTAANGAEALERLDRSVYDLILTDTKMPVLDGQEFFEELVRRYPTMRRRIAFITGDVLTPDKRAFLEGTGAPTLEKPFNLDALRRTVQRLLDD
jgi:signal transduction histidine kinase